MRVYNDHSFKKAFLFNLVKAADVFGLGYFIEETDDGDTLTYSLRGPLKWFGKIEYNTHGNPSQSRISGGDLNHGQTL